ncbi:MAG: hypothetical protein AAF495_06855 [Pseudomonadota bacterium]
MRVVGLLVVAAITVVLAAGQPRAQAPDIKGTWSGQADILLQLDGKIVKVPRLLQVVIEEVDGNLFTGRRTWQALTDDPGNVAGVDTLAATEPFIGAIDTDGVTLRFVETDDPGVMFGELLGPDRLEITYMEAWPHAVIYTVVMTRDGG